MTTPVSAAPLRQPSANVLIVQRRMAQYRVPLFEALRVLLANQGVRLSVVHGEEAREERARRDSGELSWAVRVPTFYLKIFGNRISWLGMPWILVCRQDLVIVTHENGILSNYPLFLIRALGGPRIAWWGHGPKLLGPNVRAKELVKGLTARLADWYFAYTSMSVDRVVAARVPSSRVTCLNNAVEVASPPDPKNEAWIRDRESLKHSLGVGEGPVAVYLGSLTLEKRIDVLINAADQLRHKHAGFHLVIVGDGPLRQVVQEAQKGREWVHWLGVLYGREKALACSLGHAMLNPGMVGLNIVDAFAFRLPIVTMQHELHSPEVAYLKHGENGLIVEDAVPAFVAACDLALANPSVRSALLEGCRKAAETYTLQSMARTFATQILMALGAGRPLASLDAGLTLAIVLRTFLPYHKARLRHLEAACHLAGLRLLQIEVASQDAAYGFPGSLNRDEGNRYCCFPGIDYQTLNAKVIHARVLELLERLQPDVVIGHAVPFPEGMAAIAYRNRSAARVFIVDDAWEGTDVSGPVVRLAKRWIHRSVDGALLSSMAHQSHYESLGLAPGSTSVGWSVVDNDFFKSRAAVARSSEGAVRAKLQLPPNYFLFVGRFLARKGIANLLGAYGRYRRVEGQPWSLVLIGGEIGELPDEVRHLPGVLVAGKAFGADLAMVMGLAGALVVPSLLEQWGLVVNEALAAGTPVIASRSCGAAQLIVDGVNGYTYDAGNECALAECLRRMAAGSQVERERMRADSEKSIAAWGLDRFCKGVFELLALPRRRPASIVPRATSQLWKGWVRRY